MILNPFIREKFTEKNKSIHTNDMLENGLIYLYLDFQFNMINTSTTYIYKINYFN